MSLRRPTLATGVADRITSFLAEYLQLIAKGGQVVLVDKVSDLVIEVEVEYVVSKDRVGDPASNP
jgi:hypothetical protein